MELSNKKWLFYFVWFVCLGLTMYVSMKPFDSQGVIFTGLFMLSVIFWTEFNDLFR